MQVTRRGFLGGLGALVVAFHLPTAHGATANGELNAFVAIDPDGTVAVGIPSVEMGQGTLTALPQLVADELDVDFDRVRVVHAPEKKAFRTKLPIGKDQFTGGSQSVYVWNVALREAGASARLMLIAAAAKRWGVSADQCSTEPGVVRHSTGKSAPYGDLAAEAATMKAPSKVELRRPGTIAGKSVPRKDLRGKVTGETVFGIDVRRPNMLRASVLACPVFGGTVGSVDDTACRGIDGVVDVLVFEHFVAVVAETWWPANQGIKALKVVWNEGPNAGLDSAGVSSSLRAGLDSGKTRVGHKSGNTRKALEAEAIEATYEVPYLEHAPLEPLNCTVDLTADRCRIWTGTQVQTRTVKAATEITGLPWDAIELNTHLLGGGFGRRGNIDFVEVALHVATRVDRPVQVIWSREECTRQGFYRPAAMADLRGSVKDGALEALHIHVSSDNILERYLPSLLMNAVKFAATFPLEGLRKECPYVIPHYRAELTRVDLPVPIGFWRSVGHSHNAFFLESFIDELAHAAGTDPVAFRLAMLEEEPRFTRVLETVADKAGWGKVAEGRFQGVAMMECYGSVCAEVAEISMEDGIPRVHKVTAVLDCGEVVNPAIVEAQVMGAVGFGLSSSMGERLDIDRGRIVQSNFHDYPLLRMMHAPEVEVHTVRGPDSPIGGVGEVGTPPVAPAVCNAIFAASGIRVRSLPILQALEAT